MDESLLKKSIENIIKEHGIVRLEIIINILEETLIRLAIEKSKTYNAAAERLGISKSTMYRKMKEYGIPKKRANHLARGGERDVSGGPIQQGVHGSAEGDCSV